MPDKLYAGMARCPVCGKSFYFTSRRDWGYIYGKQMLCSYHCMREREAKHQRKPEPERKRTVVQDEEQLTRQIEALQAQGMQTGEIANELGVTRYVVYNRTKRHAGGAK